MRVEMQACQRAGSQQGNQHMERIEGSARNSLNPRHKDYDQYPPQQNEKGRNEKS